MRSTSLHTRLTLSYLLVILIPVALMVLLANRITANRFQGLATSVGLRYARVLAPVFANYYERNGSWEGIDDMLQRFEQIARGRDRDPMNQRFQGLLPVVQNALMDERLIILGRNGEIIADSGIDGEPLKLTEKDKRNGVPIVISSGEDVGTLFVASSLGALRPYQSAYLRQVSLWIVAAGVLAALVGLLISTLQSRRILKPVKALVQASRLVAAGDYSQQVPVEGQDELSEMAISFNSMVKEMDEQQSLRRRSMADIAHELRTPLSVLQIDLESIKDGLTDPSPPVIDRLKAEVDHLNHLVEDLRMLSLVEAGELQLEIQPVKMGELIQYVQQRIENTAQAKGIELISEIPEKVDLMVRGDSQRLAQVLFNLLLNALQHTPRGGRVSTSAEQLGREVRVSITDNGEGIPQQDLPHIFERFYHSDLARSRITGGTGLGLAIAHSLIDAHGGRIWVQSEEGKGSTFIFSLPSA